jgi:hypothetical protein
MGTETEISSEITEMPVIAVMSGGGKGTTGRSNVFLMLHNRSLPPLTASSLVTGMRES